MNLLAQLNKNKSDLTIINILIGLFLIFIPFNYVLIINVGFPLKISEIILLLITPITCISIYNRIKSGEISSDNIPTIGIFILISFILLAILSTVVNLNYDFGYSIKNQHYRFNSRTDSILKCLYLFCSFSTFIISFTSFKKNRSFFINCFLIGAFLSAIYSWYLCLFSFFKIPYSTLPGGVEHPQAALFKLGHFIRSGSFKEGNMMGLFLFVTATVAWYERKKRLSIFLFLSIITTASSAALFCSGVFALGNFSYNIIAKKNYKILIIGFLLSLISFSALLTNSDFRYLISKFGLFNQTENKDAHFSRLERINSSIVALQIAKENPILGIGPANYPLHFSHYNTNIEFREKEEKILANNIYLEILSELGIGSFLLFVCFIYYALKASLTDKSKALLFSLIGVLIYFLAFPTFSVLFIWVYLGYILSIPYSVINEPLIKMPYLHKSANSIEY